MRYVIKRNPVAHQSGETRSPGIIADRIDSAGGRMSRITRRDFTKSATVGAAGLTALSASRVYGANDRVRVGFIGLGNRGDQVLDAFLDAQGLRGRRRLRHLPAVPRLRRRRRSAANPQQYPRLPQAARTRRTSTPSSSPRRTTGTRCR